MGGRADGCCQIGKGVREKPAPLSTPPASGLAILMIKVFRLIMMPNIMPSLLRYQSLATKTEL
ncbi:hypothetical protein Goshw_024089 [Gossypium schwendimanii]|uniref:Uncharacterized protein n=1 Tax=Gossypium schwendimanii TaxID=34291 RepID=A0A7J9LBS3_GOSSC|nr:hypothetical protein [Gossypium schwendimanii]